MLLGVFGQAAVAVAKLGGGHRAGCLQAAALAADIEDGRAQRMLARPFGQRFFGCARMGKQAVGAAALQAVALRHYPRLQTAMVIRHKGGGIPSGSLRCGGVGLQVFRFKRVGVQQA